MSADEFASLWPEWGFDEPRMPIAAPASSAWRWVLKGTAAATAIEGDWEWDRLARELAELRGEQ